MNKECPCVCLRDSALPLRRDARCLQVSGCSLLHLSHQKVISQTRQPPASLTAFENAKESGRERRSGRESDGETENRERAPQQHVGLPGKRKPPGPESLPRRQREVRGLESFYSEAPIQSHTVLYSSLRVFPYPKPISKCFRPARSSLPHSLACLALPLVSWWGQMSRLTQRLRRLT